MTIFSFPYLEHRARDGTGIFRPWVRIHLLSQDGPWKLFGLYADAGADFTLLRQGDCEALGYDLKAGEPRFMGGVCSGLTRVFIHELPLRLGTEVIPCPVAFAEKAAVPRLLGRQGVFQRFKVCYDDVGRVTEFIVREGAPELPTGAFNIRNSGG